MRDAVREKCGRLLLSARVMYLVFTTFLVADALAFRSHREQDVLSFLFASAVFAVFSLCLVAWRALASLHIIKGRSDRAGPLAGGRPLDGQSLPPSPLMPPRSAGPARIATARVDVPEEATDNGTVAIAVSKKGSAT
jgi:hypothetical protein